MFMNRGNMLYAVVLLTSSLLLPSILTVLTFFGDEVDSIRTFEVENQLSKEKKQSIAIVPELTNAADKSGVSFFEFIPRETVLAMKDFLWVRERIQVVREEALSPQALAAYEGEKTELMNLELKLIDGAEFTVRALDFKTD